MAAKFLCVVLLALVAQGYGYTEIVLADQTVTHHENPIMGVSMAIAKSFLDTLVSCNIVFPNGIIYEAFPQDTIPAQGVSFMDAVEPFRSCSIAFVGASITTEMSGTYELLSLVQHSADESQTLTRQKFILNVMGSSVEWPSRDAQ